jgi:hypothetical protein
VQQKNRENIQPHQLTTTNIKSKLNSGHTEKYFFHFQTLSITIKPMLQKQVAFCFENVGCMSFLY